MDLPEILRTEFRDRTAARENPGASDHSDLGTHRLLGLFLSPEIEGARSHTGAVKDKEIEMSVFVMICFIKRP